MPFRLFDVAKVGLTCDAVTHSTEKRKDGEVKVIVLTLRMQPFDRKYALALHEEAMRTLFKACTPEPQGHLTRVNFALGVPRQHMDCFATSETRESTRRLEHVKISGIYARTEKGMQGYALVFKATFGPADDKELGFVEAWRNGMKFVTFDEAEPSADFEEVEPGGDDDEDDDDPQQALPEGEFETDATGKPTEAPAAAGDAPEPARHAKPRHADRTTAAKVRQIARGRRR